jgi:hypothetical protein
MKYGISTDTLLRYLAFLADQNDAGISLTTIHFEGQTLPFEGTLTIETARGALTLITQKGRLVAILFADDLFMIAQNTKKLQLLLNGGCMFYTAASAEVAVRSQVEVDNENSGERVETADRPVQGRDACNGMRDAVQGVATKNRRQSHPKC